MRSRAPLTARVLFRGPSPAPVLAGTRFAVSIGILTTEAIEVSSRSLLVPFVVLAIAFSAQAEECSENEWFPDFNCDHRTARYEGFTPPTSMPYLFEDPFITTGASAHVIWHDFPWDTAFRGGDMYVAALQLRLAITDRLAFIATKDGYAWLRPGSHSQIESDDGFFDIAAGFKYALIDSEEQAFIVTPSFRLDLPVGNKDLFSGNGSGVAIPGLSAAKGIGPIHLIGSIGGRLPFETNKESTSVFYNVHVDTDILEFLVPFVELNGTTWTKSGHGERNVHTKSFGSVDLTLAQDVLHMAGVTDERRFEALDVANLGSKGVSGTTILSLAVGGRIPFTDSLSLGAYYEFPVTERQGIFEQRAAVNLHFEY
jgi:hypothetical protein